MFRSQKEGKASFRSNQLIILIFQIILPFLCYSQGEWNNWYFGDSAAITFNTNPPSALLNSSLRNLGWGYPISVSDSAGNLLFYGNCAQIWNQNHELMPNGILLTYAGLGTQQIVSCKQIGSDHLYYLVQVKDFIPAYYFGMFYSVVDMTLEGGFGDIDPVLKGIPIPGMDDAMDLLTTTRHRNNEDIWLVTKKYLTNQYASILITSSGISSDIILSNSNAPVEGVQPGNGEMRISPDGTKLVCKYFPQNDSAAEFCSYNSESGIVTPLFHFRPHINGKFGTAGVFGFSPGSNLLYLLGFYFDSDTVAGLFQYDATVFDSVSFMNSQVLICPFYNNNGSSRPLQIGPDQKIYLTRNIIDSLSTIHNPNLPGIACNYERNAICLNGRETFHDLPQFLQKYKAYLHHSGNCQTIPVQFSGDIWPPADTIRWNFGDPASGAMNISYDTTPSHIYTTPGIYTIELYVRHIDNRTDTSWITITIDETPSPGLGPDQTICQGDSVILDAGSCAGCTYEWSCIPPGFISTEQTVTLLQSGFYIVAVSSTNGCTGRDTIQLTVTAPPIIINSPLFKSICSGEATSIPLTSNLPGTSFSWNATSSSPSIIGFGPGTGDTIDQVLTNTGTISETVTYTITPSLGNCDGDSVEYVITVTPGDSVLVNITASNNPVCEGLSVTYTATPVNGGVMPAYQWQVNGINAGTNNPDLTFNPANGDLVTCTLTSNAECVTNNPATSNSIHMSVGESPDVSFTVCFDTITTLNAKPFKLKGGVPLGGTYSGTGVESVVSGGSVIHYYFDPAIAGAGIHEITYNYINEAGCQDSARISVFNFQFSIFNCNDSLTDIRDNQKYPTVLIGTQCWMASNLNYGVMISGNIPQRDNCIPEKYKKPPPGLPQPVMALT